MSIQDNIEKAKGKVKEVIGDKTDNQELRKEGKLDQASGSTKDAVDQASERINGALDSAKDDLKKRD